MTPKQYPQINLAEWRQVGEGGNGKTYVNPSRPDVILKLNNARLSTLEAVQHEFDVSKAVGAMGLPVPQVHEISPPRPWRISPAGSSSASAWAATMSSSP